MFNFNIVKNLKIKINLLLGKKKQGERVGILDQGKGTKMYNNTIIGYDTAIKEEGQNAKAVGNKIIK